MAGVLFFAAIISLVKNIRAEGTNTSVCLNKRAVLTCTTVTSSGFLIWWDSVGLPATYNSKATVGSNHTLDGFYITLSSITNTTGGRVRYTSTATTAVPVNISHDGKSLNCSDGVNVTTVSIHIIKNVSSPLNFKCVVSNCRMSTECTVNCTWDPPNDTPLCVSEYIIRSESNVGCGNLPTVQKYNFITGHVHPIHVFIKCSEQYIGFSHVQGHITNTTFPVNKFTNYLLVVVAKNYNFSQSNSNEYLLNTKKPGFDFGLWHPVNVTLDMNTTLLISWEYTPNRPPVTDQSISINGYTYVIPIANRSAMFSVTRNQTYSITFEASNVIGTHSIAKHIPVPSNGSVVVTGGVDPNVATCAGISITVFVIVVLILVGIIIVLLVLLLKKKIAEVLARNNQTQL